MLPVIRKAVVKERGWLTEEEIVDCFAVSQSLPGVLSINAAIYVGNKKKGVQGSLASLLGVILPSYISIIVILLFLGSIEENTHVLGAFEGIKAASAAMILVAAYNLGKQILKGKVEIFIAAISFAVIVFAGINAIWAIVFGGLTGLVVYQYNHRKGRAE